MNDQITKIRFFLQNPSCSYVVGKFSGLLPFRDIKFSTFEKYKSLPENQA
jgi:hypothetical protein